MVDTSEPGYESAHPLDLRTALQEYLGSRPQGWFGWLLERVDIQPQHAVLDLGCGSGGFWQAFADRAGSQARSPSPGSVLTDFSLPMLAEARKRTSQAFPSLQFVQADAAGLPVRRQSFDRVLALGLLDHFEDPGAVLAAIRACLKPGGILYAATAAGDHLEELCRLVSPLMPEVRMGAASDSFTGENGAALLKESFSTVTRHDFTDLIEFPSTGLVQAYIQSEASVVNGMQGSLGELASRIEAAFVGSNSLPVRNHKVLFIASAGG